MKYIIIFFVLAFCVTCKRTEKSYSSELTATGDQQTVLDTYGKEPEKFSEAKQDSLQYNDQRTKTKKRLKGRLKISESQSLRSREGGGSYHDESILFRTR